jgi:hypothetical protein
MDIRMDLYIGPQTTFTLALPGGLYVAIKWNVLEGNKLP